MYPPRATCSGPFAVSGIYIENDLMVYATSIDPDQTPHLRSLIRVYPGRLHNNILNESTKMNQRTV